MKFIVLFVVLAFTLTGCKDKNLSQKDLTNIPVIRETGNNNQPKETIVNPVSVPSDNATTYTPPRQNSQSDAYHIIVASFSYAERNRAEKLVKDLREKGYPAKIIDSKKRYRISIESFNNMKQANNVRDEYREITDRQDIWILKKD